MESQQPLVSNGGGLSWLLAIPMLAKQGRSALLGSSNEHLGSAWAIIVALAIASTISAIVVCWLSPGGSAWGRALIKGNIKHRNTIPGPRGLPILGSLMSMGGLAHRRLAKMAASHNAMSLMSLSLGNTRVVIASQPDTARELLNSSSFADRPLKQSAQQLLFGRAIGFAPQGEYWRNLRRIAATHLFAPKRIAAHGPARQFESDQMVEAIRNDTILGGSVRIRGHLQRASLNNIMSAVFGCRYNFDDSDDSPSIEAQQLKDMVREGFELLGAFNWADHLPVLQCVDPQNIHQRCAKLVPQVSKFVQNIINEHRVRAEVSGSAGDKSDFVDVLLGLRGEDKLADEDMIAVLWEMIFRGTDTTAILTEWMMAEMVLHPEMQRKVHDEIDSVVGEDGELSESHIPRLPYLQAVIKETLRVHPPGPLLSWARLATHDVHLAGHTIPKGTTAMVNMWAITHDPSLWSDPDTFNPDRFLTSDIDIRGNDLRLAPFGAGRRVCPGRALGMATVQFWLAQLLHKFTWLASPEHPVDLREVLKLSSEMVTPLTAIPVPRSSTQF